MGAPAKRSQLGATSCPELGGVAIRRHVLDIEAGNMMHLARRLGLRLRRWLRTMPQDVPAVRMVRVEGGGAVAVPICGPDGNQLMMPLLPDSEFRETAEMYERIVRGLLVEQRLRAVLKPNARPALTDDEAEAELAAYVRSLPEAMRAELLGGPAPDEGHAADALVPPDDEAI